MIPAILKKISAIFLLGCCMVLCSGFSAYSQDDWQVVNTPMQVFEEGYIQVIGSSEANQSRYNAIRAATVVAQRDIMEILQGISINGDTTIQDGMLQSDTIRTNVQGFLRGALKCGERYNAAAGYADVCLRLNIRGKGSAYEVLLPVLQEQGVFKFPEQRFTPPSLTIVPQQDTPAAPADASQPAPPPEPAKAEPATVMNGLIIDLAGKNFKPALANRIITTNDKVIFDPATVVPSILAERGCGGFTNKIAKAKGLLASWGADKPMIISAAEVKGSTDAVISGDDASAVFYHDQNSSFLSQSKVVFVIH